MAMASQTLLDGHALFDSRLHFPFRTSRDSIPRATARASVLSILWLWSYVAYIPDDCSVPSCYGGRLLGSDVARSKVYNTSTRALY